MTTTSQTEMSSIVKKAATEAVAEFKAELLTAKLKKSNRKRKLPPYLSAGEAKKLLETITDSKDKAITGLMYYCGLRVSEANNLQAKHVDLREKMVRVICGKGGNDRNIPIPEDFVPEITEYVSGRDPESYLFKTTVRTVQNHFKKNLEKAGLSPVFHCHSLRHSFACRLVEKNVSLEEIRRNLGHVNLNTTGIYLDVSPEQRRRGVNRAKWT